MSKRNAHDRNTHDFLPLPMDYFMPRCSNPTCSEAAWLDCTCNQVTYCSFECLRQHWNHEHEEVCRKRLASLLKDSPQIKYI